MAMAASLLSSLSPVGASEANPSSAIGHLPSQHAALPRVLLNSRLQVRPIICRASEKGVEDARRIQTSSTKLLAELLKAEDAELFATENAQSLTQEFFVIASTYLSMAKKEGNPEVVNQLERTIKIAMQAREKTLRPEIQLLNQLLRDQGSTERAKTIDSFSDHVKLDGYFFQLLNRMILDVEKQPTSRSNPEQIKLLSQLRAIQKEARDFAKQSTRE